MAEYKSFHYLMHKTPEAAAVHIVTGPEPLSFPELYPAASDSDGAVLLKKCEKSFWRTQDRVEFCMYEDRQWVSPPALQASEPCPSCPPSPVLVVTARNIEKPDEVYRSLFLALDVLYFELEARAQGHRNGVTRKKDQILQGDALAKSVADFVLPRLNLLAAPQAWPRFPVTLSSSSITATTVGQKEQVTEAAGSTSTPGMNTAAGATAEEVVERMCTFDKMSSDDDEVFQRLEVAPPARYQLPPSPFPISCRGVEFLRPLPPPLPAAATLLENTENSSGTATEKNSATSSEQTQSQGEDLGKQKQLQQSPAETSSEKEDSAGGSGGLDKKKRGASSATVAPAQSSSSPSGGRAAGKSRGSGSKSGFVAKKGKNKVCPS